MPGDNTVEIVISGSLDDSLASSAAQATAEMRTLGTASGELHAALAIVDGESGALGTELIRLAGQTSLESMVYDLDAPLQSVAEKLLQSKVDVAALKAEMDGSASPLTEFARGIAQTAAGTEKLQSQAGLSNLGRTINEAAAAASAAPFADLGGRMSQTAEEAEGLKNSLGTSNLAIIQSAGAARAGIPDFENLTAAMGSMHLNLDSFKVPTNLTDLAEDIARLGVQPVAFAADLQKMADALGVNVEDLQAYQYAARQAGVDTDTATIGLGKFISSLSTLQGSDGTGQIETSLRELGLTANDLSGDPMQTLVTFARAWDRLSDTQTKATIQAEFFKSGSASLTKLLHDLAQRGGDVSDQLDEMRQHARDAGEMLGSKVTKQAYDAEVALDGFAAQLKGNIAIGLVYAAQKAHELWNALGGLKGVLEALSVIGPSPFQIPAAMAAAEMASAPKGKKPAPLPKPESWFFKPEVPDVKQPDIEIASPSSSSTTTSPQKDSTGLQAAVEAQRQAADQAITIARDASQEILSDDRLNATERAALAKGVWDLLLNGDKLSGSLRAAAAKDLADKIASEEHLSADQRAALEKQLSALLVASGQWTSQQRAQSARDEANAESEARKKAAKDAEQADKDALAAKIEAVKTETEITIAGLEEQAAYGEITTDQQMALSQAASEQEFRDQLKIVTARRDAENQGALCG